MLALWGLFLFGTGFFVFIMFCAANGWLTFDPLPDYKELENPKSSLATEVYTADGKLLGKYFSENRSNVEFEELSPHLVKALVSTEDERYYSHSGIDFRGLVRAVIKLGKAGGASTISQQLAKMLFNEPATSTIERIKQKLQEWIIAVQLEKRYTKEEIITMYLNRFDFINNAVGIKSASSVYFNKRPNELKIHEAAMLVGMAKNPSLFNPMRRPDTTIHRRNVVFQQMLRNEHINREEFDSLAALPLKLDYQVVDHKEGVAPYFREVLRAELKDIFNEKDSLAGEYLLRKKDGSKYNIYKDGLKIYTTLDYRLQRYAEWAVDKHLGEELQEDFFNDLKKRSKDKYPFDWRVGQKEVNIILEHAMKRTSRYRVLTGQQCANCGRRGEFIKEDVKEGEKVFVCEAEDCGHTQSATPKDSIKPIFDKPVEMSVFTWQGEKDTVMSPMDSIRYYKSFLQAGLMSIEPQTGFIKAWVGGIDNKHFSYDHVKQSRRQVGSTFKPFVYSIAIQEGYSPCYEVPNVVTCFDMPEGQPDYCPENSDHIYGCDVSLKYGLANSINTVTAWVMKQFGPQAVIDLARKMGITSPLDPVPSLCLGVADISVYEMVGANATYVNKGVWMEPTFITRIEDKNGKVIKDFVPETREAMSEETAYAMLDLMKGVVDGVYNKCRGQKEKLPYTSGTGMRLKSSKEYKEYAGFTNPIAGKTGTTQNNSDGWFMGLTPDLVTGVWVGAEDRSVRFSRTYYGQGANMALPIWAWYMHKVYEDKTLDISIGDFEKPNKKLSIELDCSSYKQSQNGNNFNPEEVDFSN